MADALAKAEAKPLLSLLALGNFVVVGIISPIAEDLAVSSAIAAQILEAFGAARQKGGR